MSIEGIRAAMVGKHLQILYHGRVQKEQGRKVEYTLQYSEDKQYLLYRLMLDSLEDVPCHPELADIVVTYPTRRPPRGVAGLIRVQVPLDLYDFVVYLHDFMRATWRDEDKNYPVVARKTKAWIREEGPKHMYSSCQFMGS